MSFTEDELEAFTTILGQRFVVHRQEMEQVLDQRLNTYQQDLERRFAVFQQEQAVFLQQRLAEQGSQLEANMVDKLQWQQDQITQKVSQDVEREQQHVEAAVDRMLAAQLSGIEQLFNHPAPAQQVELKPLTQNIQPQLAAIEVQTELHWEDLSEMMGKALDDRLTSLTDAFQRAVKNLEQYISVRLHGLHDEIVRGQETGPGEAIYRRASSLDNSVSVQEILRGIEQLEHIVESMQVAMTANQALLSNRLYHHQQLPLERAHPASLPQSAPTNGSSNSLLARAKERVAHGLEPNIQEVPKDVE